ncbi:hypothetical protein [Coprococcus comes]|jgi:hypothetical protein|uniref:Uncharacterized protein n=1 Tax=Coprococcus comes TaxID=410072 RepID=A0A414U912_9FIRM|nr:hypothetical protein [Coprococcus comes]RHG58958.1 hypothetical protein DW252_12705 [Coprococcus comes]
MESNKVKGLIFPVGGEAQAFLADRDRPYRDIREAVQGEYDELGATFADVDIYVNAAGADSLLPNRAINPDAFMDDSGFLSEKSLIVGTNDGKPFSLIFGNIVALSRDETGELIDMPADIEAELKESLSDPLDGYDLQFREAFGRYQNWDLSQAQAAEIAGLSQQAFSYHVNKITNAQDTRGRGLKPLPKGFDRLYSEYKNGDISARSAATKLGITHPTFLKYVKECDVRLHKDDLVQTSNPRGLTERRGAATDAARNLNHGQNAPDSPLQDR